MPASPLTAAQSAALTEAAGLLQRGGARQAAEKLSPLIRGGSLHPDLLLTYSAACEQLGLLDQATNAVQAALQQAPDRADLWARLGRLLEDVGRSADGVAMLDRAVALDPDKAPYWYNLGVAALSAGLLERADQALQRSLEIEPTNAAAWGALGLAQQQSRALENSEGSLRRALELDPLLLSAAHNLAVTLRLLDRPAEAMALVDQAIELGLSAPETNLLRAHLLDDTGKFDDAVRAYRAIIEGSPVAIDAHEVLARLLPQLGHAGESLRAYDEALRRAPTLELYRSSLKAAWDLKQGGALERWSAEALQRFGALPDLQIMKGLALGLSGRTEQALNVLEPLICAGFTPALAQGAHYRLKLGDLRQAERHALAMTGADFTDQSAWAYLSVIWRLLDDPREQWLADYQRFVMPIDLLPPDGFDDIGAFMRALTQELNKLHGTVQHPVDQSLRQGTQTRGSLFDKRLPLIRQLAARIEQAIGEATSKLPSDSTHPFLSRNTGRTRFLGSWSVRLRSGGFHVSHIHQLGWLSSAHYVALPREVTQAGEHGFSPGALTFGVPDRDLGLDLPPRRVERPEVGRLVLFPSYFWHGTMPFKSKEPRLTVAFDAVPA